MRKWNFKVILAGDGAVGKTSIRERYMGKGFQGDYLKTIGADFATKKMEIDEDQITYQIWDLAGQDSYQAVRKTFYKGATAAIMVFDCQDPKSMTNLTSWINEAIEGSDNGILSYFVVANKVDLEESRRVSRDMSLEFCNRLEIETGIRFFYCETSALTGQNIQETFDFLAYRLLLANNIQNATPPKDIDGIIDIKEVMESTKVVEATESQGTVSSEAFNKLVDRIDKLEDKMNTMQTILKQIVQKL
ncbi:MAG: GTP-binding protein [Candidatus Heimdallarchaeota archaeon]|nr:GTP-binding protein [Candidatus Heimdallarchaeota archaeon]